MTGSDSSVVINFVEKSQMACSFIHIFARFLGSNAVSERQPLLPLAGSAYVAAAVEAYHCTLQSRPNSLVQPALSLARTFVVSCWRWKIR